MKPRHVALFTLSVALGCSGGGTKSPPAEYLVGPLALLPGITPGMSVRSLRALRPGVADAPYTGLSDSVGQYAVFYIVGNVEEDPAPDGARVREVRAERRFADSVSATDEARALVGALGGNAQCRTFPAGATLREHTVRWKDQEIAIRHSRNLLDEHGRDTTFYVVAVHWRTGQRLSPAGDGMACLPD